MNPQTLLAATVLAAASAKPVSKHKRPKKINTGFFNAKQWKARKARNKQAKRSRRRNRS